MQKVTENDLAYRDGDSGVKYLMRGPMIDWGVLLVKPGETLAPHYHDQVEETFYVLRGRGLLVVDDERIPATVGDAFRVEPTERHEIVNDGVEPLKMVFIKCPYLPEDKVDC